MSALTIAKATALEAPQARKSAPAVLPLWFERLLIVICASVVFWGAAGVLLAYFGDYTLARAAGLGSVGTIFGLAVAASRRPPADQPRPTSGPAIVICLGAVGLAIWNGMQAGHHIVVGRDPGTYMIAGKWLAQHGTLIVPAGTGWPTDITQLSLSSSGMFAMPGGTLQFQFAHFLPALLAEADGVGGDALMFRTNAVIGALALLAIFAVGCQLTRRPWPVAAAVLGLGVSIPEINSLRDTFSETSTQFVLWCGIWLLICTIETRHSWHRLGLAFLAGASIGAAVMTRIDGVAYLTLLPVLAAFGWLAWRGQRGLLLMYSATLLGLIPTVVIGTIDVQRRAGHYYGMLRHQVLELYASCAGAIVLAVVLVIVWPRISDLWRWVSERRRHIAIAGGSVAAAALVFAWTIRPAVQHLTWPNTPENAQYRSFIADLERRAGLDTSNQLRTFGERSVEWLSWYLGPIAVGLAIIAVAILVSRLIQKPTFTAVIVLALAGVLSAEYLWNSHVNGDQPWAMRRFVPAALPLFAILAALGLTVVGDWAKRLRGRAAAQGVLAAGMALLVAFPWGRSAPVRHASPYENFDTAIRNTCAQVGPNAALLVMPPLASGYSQTLRSWCNVPVAGLSDRVSQATLHQLAHQWRSQGRTLWLIAEDRANIREWLPSGSPRQLAAETSHHEFTVTLIHPPESYGHLVVNIWGTPISP